MRFKRSTSANSTVRAAALMVLWSFGNPSTRFDTLRQAQGSGSAAELGVRKPADVSKSQD